MILAEKESLKELAIKKISKEIKLDTKTLKRWVQKGAKRLPGCGRKVQDY